MRRVFLDLYCGAGGAARGYRSVLPLDVEIVGVDVEPQPRYPYRFVQADALAWLDDLIAGRWRRDFLAYGAHASPPCQRFSDLAARWGNRDDHPDLIDPTRRRLEQIDTPWAMENVPEAPLRRDVVLCGTMFPGLRVIRHRAFEANFRLPEPPEHRPHPLVYTRDKRKRHYGRLDERLDFVTVTGGGNCSVEAARDAMGVDWGMTKAEVNEAIPPAYAAWVGTALVAARGRFDWHSPPLHRIQKAAS